MGFDEGYLCEQELMMLETCHRNGIPDVVSGVATSLTMSPHWFNSHESHVKRGSCMS